MASLVVYRDGQREAVHALDGDVTKIGRLESSHVRLNDITVSRMHAVMERSDIGWVIIDLGSTEGTFIGDERINKAEVSLGDQIRIGPFVLVIEAATASPPPPPQPPSKAPPPPVPQDITKPRSIVRSWRCPACGHDECAASGEIAAPFVATGDLAHDRADALSRLRADICADCGHMALFVHDPSAFLVVDEIEPDEVE